MGDLFIPVENPVTGHEAEENGGGNALVAVAEGMILDDEIEQMRRSLIFTCCSFSRFSLSA